MLKSYRLDNYNAQEILDNQLKLIGAFNKKNLPVIIVMGDYDSKLNLVMIMLLCNELEENGKKGLNELISELKNVKYSKSIKKSEYDVFFNTDLEQYCKMNNIDELYFCGVYFGVCVFFSAAGTAMRRI